MISGSQTEKNCMNDYVPADQPPEIDGHYLVKCENFMCMAIFDKNGKWKSLSNGKELPAVINFCAIQ
jgi:hypothetical protein